MHYRLSEEVDGLLSERNNILKYWHKMQAYNSIRISQVNITDATSMYTNKLNEEKRSG